MAFQRLEKSHPSVLPAAAVLARAHDLDHVARNRLLNEVWVESDKMSVAAMNERLNQGLQVLGGGFRVTPAHMERARKKADEWVSLGVWFYRATPLGTSNPILLMGWGDESALIPPRAAILNSRKPRRVSPHDRWLHVARDMAGQALDEGRALLGSMGSDAYEAVCFLAGEKRGDLVIVVPGLLPALLPDEQRARFDRDYGWLASKGRCMFVSPFTPGRLPTRAEAMQRRDECLVMLADRIMAVEIRPGGHMERLVLDALHRGVPVSVCQPRPGNRSGRANRYLIEQGGRAYPGPRLEVKPPEAKKAATAARPIVRADGRDVHPGSVSMEEPKVLYHYTRTCPGPWPGQSREKYYRALFRNEPGAGHAAFDTLKRILMEQRIRGGARLIRGGTRCVSLTPLGPGRIKEQVRWRRALIRWSFEPYGLGISREILEKLGARRVLYGDEEAWKRLPDRDRYRFQLVRPGGYDWSWEWEWRLAGDLDLKSVPKGHVTVVVQHPFEAEDIASRFQWPVEAARRHEVF